MSPCSPSDRTTPGSYPEISGAVTHCLDRGLGEARGSPAAEVSSGPAAAAIQTRTTPIRIDLLVIKAISQSPGPGGVSRSIPAAALLG